MITIKPLDNNHLTEIIIAEDPQIEEIHNISHRIDIFDQTVKTIKIEISIQEQTQTEKTTQITIGIVHTQTSKIDIIENDRSRNTSYKRNRNYSNNWNRHYPDNRSRTYSNNRSNYKSYQNRARDNFKNRNFNYSNRQRIYSQSPHRNNTQYQNSQQRCRSSTLKHQRQIELLN